MERKFRWLFCLLAHAQLVIADLAIYCEHKTNDNLKGYAGFDEYRMCGDFCTCYAYELLCLQRQDNNEITLESVSHDFAKECPITKCLCNLHGRDNWETTKQLNGGKPLPHPIKVELHHFDELKEKAVEDSQETLYETQIMAELRSGHHRTDKTVIHEINYGESMPSFSTNPELPTYLSGCRGSMMCDMHYELDWSYRLRTRVTCEEAERVDPCFATTACICDNGFFRVSEKMPAKPKDLVYDGFVEVLQEYERVEELKKQPVQVEEKVTEDSDSKIFGFEIWQVATIGSAILVIIAVVVLVCCCCKRCKKRGTPTEQASKDKYAIDDAEKNAKDDENPDAKQGTLTKKKRKFRRKRTLKK